MVILLWKSWINFSRKINPKNLFVEKLSDFSERFLLSTTRPNGKKEEIAAAFEEAKKNTKAPTVIEFIIDPEEMVYPMIKPGGTLEDMIMDC